jgi:hypothetical protein
LILKHPPILRIVILLTLLGAVAGAALLPYSVTLMGDKWDTTLQKSGLPAPALLGVIVVQATVTTFIMSVLGLLMARKVGLGTPLLRRWVYSGDKPRLSGKWILIGVLGSFIGTVLLVLLEKYVFLPHIPKLNSMPSIALWKGAISSLYGGIVEEVMLRLFVMTGLVWLLSKLRIHRNAPIPAIIYIVSIFVASLLFGLGHLPATASLFGELTPMLVIRCFIGNGLLGLWFGYLYWKKGWEYAVFAHFSADLFLHVLFA